MECCCFSKFMRLSIITINYNNKDGLQKTIESIVTQSFNDFEWIVIDGGSTDGSRELIERYADHMAYWVSEPDKGVYNAMNKGIMVAKGEYINFMNSGDYLASPTILEEVFTTPRTADVLYGYMMRGSLDGEVNNLSMMKPNLSWIDLYGDGLPHQSTFIKRSLFDKFGLYDESLKAVSDWKFFVKAIVYHKTTSEFVPLKISIYEEGGISDVMGGEERKRVQNELFPRAMVETIPVVEAYDRIQSHHLTAKLYSCVDKLAKRLERRQKS